MRTCYFIQIWAKYITSGIRRTESISKEDDMKKLLLTFCSVLLVACGKDPGSAQVGTYSGTGTTTVVAVGPAPSPTPSGIAYSQQYEVTWTASVAPGAVSNYTSEVLAVPRQYTMPAMNQITDGTFVQVSELVRVTLTLGPSIRCTYTTTFGQHPYSYDSGQCPAAGTLIDLPAGSTVSFDLFDNGNTATRTVSAHTTYLE